jgi:hypothetical protein
MNSNARWRVSLCLWTLLVLSLPLQAEQPLRILFVGNSYLYYNDSLHNHVGRIAEELHPQLLDKLDYKSSTIGGSSLSHHPMEHLLTPGRIGVDEPFEWVVLQGGSSEPLSARRRAAFIDTVKDYDRLIKRRGGQTALFMTQAYAAPHERVEEGQQAVLAAAYAEAAAAVGARVIPVGLAFELSYKRRPELPLHMEFDGSHPSLHGTYLAACVVYLTLYGGSLEGLQYDYFGRIPAEITRYLQKVAEDTVAAYPNLATIE